MSKYFCVRLAESHVGLSRTPISLFYVHECVHRSSCKHTRARESISSRVQAFLCKWIAKTCFCMLPLTNCVNNILLHVINESTKASQRPRHKYSNCACSATRHQAMHTFNFPEQMGLGTQKRLPCFKTVNPRFRSGGGHATCAPMSYGSPPNARTVSPSCGRRGTPCALEVFCVGGLLATIGGSVPFAPDIPAIEFLRSCAS